MTCVTCVQNDADQERIEPKEANVVEGESVDFKCKSKTVAQWLLNDGELLNNSKLISKHVLRISSATVFNKGHYECKGTNELDSPFFSTAALTIIGM